MLEWQEDASPERKPEGSKQYPAPQRTCLMCGKERWIWNGTQYICGPEDPAHEERRYWTWIYAGGQKTSAAR
jgi:hypothetical protein